MMKKIFIMSFFVSFAQAAVTKEALQKSSQMAIRGILDPIVEKYCPKTCRVLSISSLIQPAVHDSLSPGFDEIDPKKLSDLEIDQVKVKLVFDEKMSESARTQLTSLMNQSFLGLDYDVALETSVSRFPMTKEVENKLNEAKMRISKKFSTILQDIVHQFCPEKCMISDMRLKAEISSSEDLLSHVQPDEMIDSDVPVQVTEMSATFLFDESLPSEDQKTILEMAKFKTTQFRNVSFLSQVIRFPQITSKSSALNGSVVNGLIGVPGGVAGSQSASQELRDSKQNTASDSKLSQSEHNTKEDKVLQTQQQNQQSKEQSEKKSLESSSSSNVNKADRVEKTERFEKIERVESGDAVQQELKKIKIFGILFCAGLVALLVFIAMSVLKSPAENRILLEKMATQQGSEGFNPESSKSSDSYSQGSSSSAELKKRLEVDRLHDELLSVFVQNPKVSKIIFSSILMEDGIEVAASYLKIFGEHVFLELLKDASIQREMNDLVNFYARSQIELSIDDQLSLLKKLHNKTVSGKITASASSSAMIFDFLLEMDANQVEELMNGESADVKAIVLTQCDNQKRAKIFSRLDSSSRMAVMTRLSHIDYLPKNYIYNVAMALKRKKKDNPKLNTESLPGSDVLLSLLENTSQDLQKAVVKNLGDQNPESTRLLMNKLVSLDTLKYLRDGQVLEVILSLKHDELLQFLKGAPQEIKAAIFLKAPSDLVSDLEEEMLSLKTVSKEGYSFVERKVINKIKMMAHEGQINLLETNERMFMDAQKSSSGFVSKPME
jgi:flagellar motor switch protein FliG